MFATKTATVNIIRNLEEKTFLQDFRNNAFFPSATSATIVSIRLWQVKVRGASEYVTRSQIVKGYKCNEKGITKLNLIDNLLLLFHPT